MEIKQKNFFKKIKFEEEDNKSIIEDTIKFDFIQKFETKSSTKINYKQADKRYKKIRDFFDF